MDAGACRSVRTHRLTRSTLEALAHIIITKLFSIVFGVRRMCNGLAGCCRCHFFPFQSFFSFSILCTLAHRCSCNAFNIRATFTVYCVYFVVNNAREQHQHRRAIHKNTRRTLTHTQRSTMCMATRPTWSNCVTTFWHFILCHWCTLPRRAFHNVHGWVRVRRVCVCLTPSPVHSFSISFLFRRAKGICRVCSRREMPVQVTSETETFVLLPSDFWDARANIIKI